jgi:hypothetical protein
LIGVARNRKGGSKEKEEEEEEEEEEDDAEFDADEVADQGEREPGGS